ncbi:unnamed protein product [Spodoptera exigua]|nr:unnamed protein product [Spodoptera exigua]
MNGEPSFGTNGSAQPERYHGITENRREINKELCFAVWALSQHVLHRVDGETVGGPMTAYSTIQFVVQKHHFVRGKIKIRCTASVYSIYLQSLEKSAEEERIRTTPVSLPEVHEAVVYSIHRLPETTFEQHCF